MPKPFFSGLDTLPREVGPACLFCNSGCPPQTQTPPPPGVGVGQEWVGTFYLDIIFEPVTLCRP